MSEVFKNKQLLITIGEIAVIGGTIFYFSKKNKQLSTQIEILAKKFEEQQLLINSYEEAITHLMRMCESHQAFIDNMTMKQKIEEPPQPKSIIMTKSGKPDFIRNIHKNVSDMGKRVNQHVPQVRNVERVNQHVPQVRNVERVNQHVPQVRNVEDEIEDESEEEIDDSEIDEEIHAELQKLDEEENILKVEESKKKNTL